MSRTHQRWVFILITVIAFVLVAACQPAATPTPTPRPTATAVPPTVPPTSAPTSEVTAEVTTAATAMAVAPTQEASAAATVAITSEATSAATAMAQPTEVMTVEAITEVTMEVTSEATIEATPEVTTAPTALPTQALGTIIEVAKADGNFGTLLSALDKAGLTATLSGKGPFTVFAPTDAAFKVLLSSMNMTASDLLSRSDLADILKYHVVPGMVTADDLAKYRSNDNPDQIIVPTLDGAKTLSLTFAADGTITINGTAKVTLKNVQASNGVIHVIDAVLMPPAPEVATPEVTAAPTMEVTPEATAKS